MNDRLNSYLNGVFAPYEEINAVKVIKEELYTDLTEKIKELKNQGHDEETAFQMAIDSVGDITEIIESIAVKTKELKGMTKQDFSQIDLRGSDFKGVTVHDGKFIASDLRNSDFTGADLKSSSFRMSDLRNVIFDGADLTSANLTMCDIRNTTFKNSILDNANFSSSDLADACFDNQTFIGTVFDACSLVGASFKNAVIRNISVKHAYFKKAVFAGARMDKLTYAVLRASKADLTNVIII